MYTLLKDARHAASEGLDHASEAAENVLDGAKSAAESVKNTAEHSTASLFATALKGLSMAAGLASTLRRFDLDNGLSWFGLARRRSPFFTFAAFGTGVLIGTGIGCLIAPMSGAEARRAIRERLGDYTQRGGRAMRRGKLELEKLEREAEQIAGNAVKAASAVKDAAMPPADRPNGRPTPNTMHS
jgi:hypothetical protein